MSQYDNLIDEIPEEFVVLARIIAHPESTIISIARALHVSRQQTYRWLAVLEKRGLIEHTGRGLFLSTVQIRDPQKGAKGDCSGHDRKIHELERRIEACERK